MSLLKNHGDTLRSQSTTSRGYAAFRANYATRSDDTPHTRQRRKHEPTSDALETRRQRRLRDDIGRRHVTEVTAEAGTAAVI